MEIFKVSGMTCGHCTAAVTNAIHEVDPAAPVQVDLGTGRVEVDSFADREALTRAIEDAGYSVESVERG